MASTAALTGKVVSDHNRRRLGNVIDEARRRGTASPELLMFLEEKLELAKCVPPTDVPDDVVTMNSKFRLRDLGTNEVQTFVLCYPDAMGLPNGYLSVLDPIGCAVLGCRVGDEIVTKGPIGARRLQLVEVLY
jgi:regulator of nucleoside diphosphate kinase